MNNVDVVSEKDFPVKVHLYECVNSPENFDIKNVKKYLDNLDIFEEVNISGPFFQRYVEDIDEVSKEIAKTRIKNLESMDFEYETTDKIVKFEKGEIKGSSPEKNDVVYDGFKLRRVFMDLVPDRLNNESNVHVVYSNKFFATWKPATERYHARVSVYGRPSIISLAGIVDAPARPRGFYEAFEKDGEIEVRNNFEEFDGEFVWYDDERISEIMKGYAMQAVFYNLAGGPFCDDKGCRLYNPHLQRNILEAQMSESEFCDEHSDILEKMKEFSS